MIWQIILMALMFLSPLSLPANPIEEENVKVSLVSEEKSVQPGHPFWVAIRMQMHEGWHTYWKNPGDAGLASSIDWQLPAGYTASAILWPTPKHFTLEGVIGYGYEGESTFLVQITPPPSTEARSAALSAHVKWLVCSESMCVPGDAEIKIDLPIAKENPQKEEANSALFASARAKLPVKQEASAELKDTVLEIRVHLPGHDPEQAGKIYFFPEQKESIDHREEPSLVAIPDLPDYYLLVLKRHPNSNQFDSVKGVALFAHAEEEKARSIEIDAPLIAMNEPSKVSYAPEFEGGLLMALLLAFCGGMILNLMPCVLPVLSFKILSFVNLAGKSRWTTINHGIAFSVGVLCSFWILAGALLLLQAYGHAAGWGFQLQEPSFVAILAAILFLSSMSLFGVFELATFGGNLAAQKQEKRLFGSFFSGVLATAVATPCTGPFLGSAVGFAFTVPYTQALMIFTMMGFGMAFPYLLLSIFPKLLRFMPRPGPWMDTFKQLMGFLILATVLWLMWVFSAQTSALAVVLLLIAFFWLAIASWIYGRWGAGVNKARTRWISYAFILLMLGAGGLTLKTALSPEFSNVETASQGEWETFSPQRVAELQKQGIPVFIDFTAKWCLICQVNHLALSTDHVKSKMNEKGVVRMKADWTNNDPMIAEELRKHGRNSVPLYLLYNGDESAPKVLPQVLTPEVVLDHLNELENDEDAKSAPAIG